MGKIEKEHLESKSKSAVSDRITEQAIENINKQDSQRTTQR